LPIVRKLAPNYTRHPDTRQEAFFYAMLADALDNGAVTKKQVEKEVRLGPVRPDSEALIERYRGQVWPSQEASSKAA
jgi:hypothetical protein